MPVDLKKHFSAKKGDDMNNPLLEKIKQICKDEEYILLFDSGEGMDWGHPTVFPDGILLTAGSGQTIDGFKSWFYKWEDISVIAHRGFVIRRETDNLQDFGKQKVCHIQLKNGGGRVEDDSEYIVGIPFLCAMGVHNKEFDPDRGFERPKRAYANEPIICLNCGERTFSYRYFGDPLEINGEFSLLGNGIYVQQQYGAEGIIMPMTDIIQVQ